MGYLLPITVAFRFQFTFQCPNVRVSYRPGNKPYQLRSNAIPAGCILGSLLFYLPLGESVSTPEFRNRGSAILKAY